MLHPIMPFITEDIWQILHSILFPDDHELKEFKSIMVAPWPEYDKSLIDDKIIDLVEQKFELISAGRNLRSEYDIPPATELKFFIKPENESLKDYFCFRTCGT